ncbi:MAG: hypothetical protein B7Z78_12475 [Rhodospirillales bacterium 20-60-12]|nr:MAG: hypothetical protein B7Z78_12475 [Rhodospirillales bacterium 20-60-12]HQT68409.1 F0F1 ATP synthase subunit B [Acetobacteraceae bacterium]
MKRVFPGLLIALAPGAALAGTSMPQMDFSNILTISQVAWMAVILILLYALLSVWALPQLGQILQTRAARIAADLDAAHAAKAAADAAIAELTRSVKAARDQAQAEIAQAIDAAKHAAGQERAELNARLEQQLQAAEAHIQQARQASLAAIEPLAAQTAGVILRRLTGIDADPAAMAASTARLLAARAAQPAI